MFFTGRWPPEAATPSADVTATGVVYGVPPATGPAINDLFRAYKDRVGARAAQPFTERTFARWCDAHIPTLRLLQRWLDRHGAALRVDLSTARAEWLTLPEPPERARLPKSWWRLEHVLARTWEGSHVSIELTGESVVFGPGVTSTTTFAELFREYARERGMARAAAPFTRQTGHKWARGSLPSPGALQKWLAFHGRGVRIDASTLYAEWI